MASDYWTILKHSRQMDHYVAGIKTFLAVIGKKMYTYICIILLSLSRVCVCVTVYVGRDIYKHSLLTETLWLSKKNCLKLCSKTVLEMTHDSLWWVQSVHCKDSKTVFLLTLHLSILKEHSISLSYYMSVCRSHRSLLINCKLLNNLACIPVYQCHKWE